MISKSNIVPIVLFAAYIVLFIVLGIAPYDRAVWFAENGVIVPIVVALAIMYAKGIRFSNLSYILMSFLIIMHTIGGHFTFEKVPFDWFSNFFGFERNHYDRIAHFTVGFYAYPIVEILLRKNVITKKWVAYLFGLFAIMSVAAIYEVFEWQYAILGDPEAGLAVLGSQGDIWDAQKDILSDTLGAIAALILFKIVNFKKKYENRME